MNKTRKHMSGSGLFGRLLGQRSRTRSSSRTPPRRDAKQLWATTRKKVRPTTRAAMAFRQAKPSSQGKEKIDWKSTNKCDSRATNEANLKNGEIANQPNFGHFSGSANNITIYQIYSQSREPFLGSELVEYYISYKLNGKPFSDKSLTIKFDNVKNKPTRELWYKKDLTNLLKSTGVRSNLFKLAVHVAASPSVKLCNFDKETRKITGCKIEIKYDYEETEDKYDLTVKFTKAPPNHKLDKIDCTYIDILEEDGAAGGECE